MLFFCGTQISNANKFVKFSASLGLINCAIQPFKDLSRDLFWGWKASTSIDVLHMSDNYIIAHVVDARLGGEFNLFCCYWHSQRSERLKDIEYFSNLRQTYKGKGDFNLVYQWKKNMEVLGFLRFNLLFGILGIGWDC